MTNQSGSTDARALLAQLGVSYEIVRQNRPLDEGAFLRFARDCGIGVAGVVTGEPGRFHQLGWLREDDRDEQGSPYFHPFRIYPLHGLINACDLHIAAASSVNRDRLMPFLEQVVKGLPTLDQIGTYAQQWNAHCDLAVLLEPIFWPEITGQYTLSAFVGEEEYLKVREQYRDQVMKFVQSLDPKEWERVHEAIRWQAEALDPNGRLYILLRVGTWTQRKELKGRLSGALWFRHMAEIIRRAFEHAHGVKWREEDQAGEQWFSGARQRLFGNDRPLDFPLASKPYLALHFGLFTGSVARWYVEGDTEYYAVAEILPNAERGGIELINLRGNIEDERANAALRLVDGLQQDRNLRRFSIVSFDTDVAANVKVVQNQIAKGRIVGFIAAHRPDFEFANFSLDELVEIAATMDDEKGFTTDGLRNGDWRAVANARTFADQYCRLSARKPRSLKGAEWGAALARYAAEHPSRDDTGKERKFLETIGIALRSRSSNYDYQAQEYTFDQDSFDLIRSVHESDRGV